MDYTDWKSKFWVFALLLFIIAPIVILLTPMIVSVTISDTPDKIVFIPKGTSMIMYGLAFAVVIVVLWAMYFSKSKVFNILTRHNGSSWVFRFFRHRCSKLCVSPSGLYQKQPDMGFKSRVPMGQTWRK